MSYMEINETSNSNISWMIIPANIQKRRGKKLIPKLPIY